MKKLLMVCGLFMMLASCYNDRADQLYVTPKTTTCDTSNTSYATTVLPIMKQYCATSGCHDGSNPTARYNMKTYDGLLLAVQSGQLIPAINQTGAYPSMPQTGAKLSDCNISLMQAWINNGAQNN